VVDDRITVRPYEKGSVIVELIKYGMTVRIINRKPPSDGSVRIFASLFHPEIEPSKSVEDPTQSQSFCQVKK
jgi:hypothetical protein